MPRPCGSPLAVGSGGAAADVRKNKAMVVLIVVLSLGVLYLVASFVIVDAITRPTSNNLEKTPSYFGLAYEAVSFTSRMDHVDLKGWYIPGVNPRNATIIVIPGGKSDRNDEGVCLLDMCIDLAKSGYDVLSFDKRGTGESAHASLRDRTCYEQDVGGAIDFARARRPCNDLFLLGTSVGAAASVILAGSGERGIDAIVADSCFARLSDVIIENLKAIHVGIILVPGLYLWARTLYSVNLMSPIEKVSSVTCPIFFIHGAQDKAIPLSEASELFARARHPLSRTWIVEKGGHSRCYCVLRDEYISAVTRFFDEVRAAKLISVP